jgi:hypothetical protein
VGPNHRSDSSADSAAAVSPLAAAASGASAARMRPATWRNTAHSAGARASASSDAAASACGRSTRHHIGQWQSLPAPSHYMASRIFGNLSMTGGLSGYPGPGISKTSVQCDSKQRFTQ